MAVKITVYGEAKMEQIERAKAQLAALENQAKTSAGGFEGSMLKIGGAVSSAGAKMSGVGDSMTKNVTVPLLAVGAGLFKAAQGAAEDEAASSKLAVALKNTAGATNEQVAAVEDWISKQTLATGIADDQIRPSLARLTASTKDVGEAQKLAALAMEISVNKGIPLTTVSNALAKANDGQTTALKKLGISLGDQAKHAAEAIRLQTALEKAQTAAGVALEDYGPKSKEYERALAKVSDTQSKLNAITKLGVDWTGELGKQFGGALAADAQTAEGQMRRTKVAFSEATEQLGYAFLPIMTQVTGILSTSVVPVITKLTEAFSSLSPGMQQGVVYAGALTAAIGPVLSITGRLTSGVGTLITGLSNAPAAFSAVASGAKALWAVLAANPWMALAAVIGIVVMYVITHWDQVKEKTLAVWNWVQEKVGAAFEFIKNLALNWTIAGQIVKHWDTIKAAAAAAWDWIKDAVGNAFNFIVNLAMNWTIQGQILKHWDQIKAGAAAAWEWVKDKVGAAFETIKNLALNWTIAGQIIKHWDAIKNGAAAAWDAVTTFFRNAPGRIMNALGDLGSLLIAPGRQLVMGLWNGISDVTGWVLDRIRSLGSSILDAVKSIFGISSPSREMYAIGEYLGKGLALGISSSTSGVLASAKSLTTATLGAFSGGASFAVSSSSSFTPGGGSYSSSTRSTQVVIAPGAVQVTVAGGDYADTKSAVTEAFDQLVRALGAK